MMTYRDSGPNLIYPSGKLYFHISAGRKRGLNAKSQVICAALQTLHRANHVRLTIFIIGNKSPAFYEASPRLFK